MGGASGVDGEVGGEAVAVAQRTVVPEKAAMPNHASHLLAEALIWVVEEEALPGWQLRLHRACSSRGAGRIENVEGHRGVGPRRGHVLSKSEEKREAPVS